MRKFFHLKSHQLISLLYFIHMSNTLRAETFVVFMLLASFWRKFMNLKILKQPNVKVFSRKIIDIFKIAKVFLSVVKHIFQQI